MVNKKSPQPIGAVVRQLRGLQAPAALTNAQRQLVESSLLILGEEADAKDAAYLARELVQESLPHSNPGDIPLWTRRNGEVTLTERSLGCCYFGLPLKRSGSVVGASSSGIRSTDLWRTSD